MVGFCYRVIDSPREWRIDVLLAMDCNRNGRGIFIFIGDHFYGPVAIIFMGRFDLVDINVLGKYWSKQDIPFRCPLYPVAFSVRVVSSGF